MRARRRAIPFLLEPVRQATGSSPLSSHMSCSVEFGSADHDIRLPTVSSGMSTMSHPGSSTCVFNSARYQRELLEGPHDAPFVFGAELLDVEPRDLALTLDVKEPVG